MPHIAIFGTIDFESGDRERWLAHTPTLIEETEKEPGSRFYSISADPASTSRIKICEVYEDRNAFELHKTSDYVTDFMKATAECRVVQHSVGWYEAKGIEPG